MYLWKSKDLAGDLKDNLVSESEKLKYMLFGGIATLLAYDPIFYYDLPYRTLDTIISVLVLIITVVGTILCYKANKAGDNHDFITRYICLCVPIGIKAVLIMSLTIVVFILLEIMFEFGILEENTKKADIFEVMLVTVFLIYIYWNLVKHFELAAGRAE